MATVRVVLPIKEFTRPRTRAMAILSPYRRVDVPYAPREVSVSGYARPANTLDRPGRKPLLRMGTPSLREETLTIIVAYPDDQKSIEPILAKLIEMAEYGDQVMCAYGPLERGVWRITNLTINTTARKAGSQDVTRADVSFTFTEASDAKVNISPNTGGAKPASKPAAKPVSKPSTVTTKPTGSVTTYVVKKGDTLSAIAGRLLGEPSRWQEIASLNGVRDPRKLQIGQRLKIPKR